MFIGAVVVVIVYKLHFWVERRFKIDDAVGAVAVHGYAGFLGVVIAGFMLWGYPTSPNPEYAIITPWGNFIGALIMFVILGFLPGFIFASILKALGILRVPAAIEIVGLDVSATILQEHEEAEMVKAERRAVLASHPSGE
jgi:ammonia channel protein AmtB